MKKRYLYALSFFIPLITLICGMIYLGVTPFGDKSLLIIDGLHQYMPFFSVLYDKLRGGETLFYTFRTGLGVNFLSLFSYYLCSPLNLIIVLFQREELNMVVSWLIIFKISLSGLFAGIYFTSKSEKPGIHVPAIAIAYALNGYMVGYCWNVMWLDAIMVFPLIMMGMDRLIEKKDGRLYGIALFYALLCNYYISFMICLFCVIWYILHRFESIKQFILRGLVFAVYSLLAGGMAAVILVPAYMGIRHTFSGDKMQLPSHRWITGFWELISRQFDMAYPVTHDNFDGNANLYFGIFSLILLVLYFLNRKISITEKLRKLILVVFFYVSFNEKILNFIWHGFHDQYGIPNRFSFLYGFVLLTMAFEVLERIGHVRMWESVMAAVAALGLLGACCYFDYAGLETEVIWSAAFLCVVYGLILFLMKKDKKRTAFYKLLLPSVIAGEMIVTSLLGFDSNGQIYIPKFFSATKDMEEALAARDDGTFYRSEVAVSKIVDESTWYPMKAVSLFGSTARAGMVDLMDSMGFNTGINEYLYKGGNPVSNLMLDIRDIYYHEGDRLRTNYKEAGTYGSMTVYESPEPAMSPGYGISLDIDEWYYYSDYPFRVLNDFCYRGYGVNTVFEDIPVEDPVTKGCTARRTNNGEYYFTYEDKEPDNLAFELDVPEGSEDFYIFYDGTQVENVKISVNGSVVEHGDVDGRILSVGKVETGSVVTVEMSLKGEESSGYIRLSAASFSPENYKSLVQEMTCDMLEITKMTDCHIEGRFEAVEEEYLFFSIPYDEGWTVRIDGKKEETTTIGNAFLSVIIPEGEHEITMDFVPEGVLPGACITVFSVLSYIALCIITHKRRKADRKRAESVLSGGREDGEEEETEIAEQDDNESYAYNDGENEPEENGGESTDRCDGSGDHPDRGDDGAVPCDGGQCGEALPGSGSRPEEG